MWINTTKILNTNQWFDLIWNRSLNTGKSLISQDTASFSWLPISSNTGVEIIVHENKNVYYFMYEDNLIKLDKDKYYRKHDGILMYIVRDNNILENSDLYGYRVYINLKSIANN